MDDQSYDAVVDSPIGRLGIRLHDGSLRKIEFLGDDVALQSTVAPAAHRIVAEIRAYFETGQNANALDIDFEGTEFQCRVWKALGAIPAGQVTTYGALAQKLGTSARAVGNACRHNPVPILVPCHRVVARNGLGGFAGDRDGRLVDIKRRLLAHEGVEIDVPRPHMA
jgi:methylated-DNA-[protein]-cysteine S-methyltransferase